MGKPWAMATRHPERASVDAPSHAGRRCSARLKAELEALEQKSSSAFGAEWLPDDANSRNLLIFPNLIINDIMAITVRTFFPVAPDT